MILFLKNIFLITVVTVGLHWRSELPWGTSVVLAFVLCFLWITLRKLFNSTHFKPIEIIVQPDSDKFIRKVIENDVIKIIKERNAEDERLRLNPILLDSKAIQDWIFAERNQDNEMTNKILDSILSEFRFVIQGNLVWSEVDKTFVDEISCFRKIFDSLYLALRVRDGFIEIGLTFSGEWDLSYHEKNPDNIISRFPLYAFSEIPHWAMNFKTQDKRKEYSRISNALTDSNREKRKNKILHESGFKSVEGDPHMDYLNYENDCLTVRIRTIEDKIGF